LNGKSQILGMRESATDALRGNREVAGRGIRGSTKYYGNTHASSDVEGARGIRGDTGRESAERNPGRFP
jgi:hypothetical protein